VVNETILAYVKEETDKGVSIDVIRNSLVQSNWALEDIDQAIALVSQSSAQQDTSTVSLAHKIRLGIGGKGKFAAIFAVFLLLFFIIFSSLSVYANLKLPLVSEKFRRQMVLLYYKVPFIPKTPEQIIFAAVHENTKLESYTPDFSVRAELKSINVTAISFDFKARGPVDITKDNKVSYDLAVNGSASFLANNITAGGRIRKVGDNVYFKLDTSPTQIFAAFGGLLGGGPSGADQTSPEIKQNMAKLLENWIVVDARGPIESEARKNLEANQESIINKFKEDTEKILSKSTVIKETKKLKDEEISGVSSYHLRLIPSKNLIRSLMKDYPIKDGMLFASSNPNMFAQNSSPDISESIEKLQFDVWFGKKDTILRKTAVIAVFNLGKLSKSRGGGGYDATPSIESAIIPGLGDLTNTSLSLSSVITISDIGKKSVFAVPSPVMTSKEYSKAMEDAIKTKAQREAEKTKKLYDSNLSKVKNALTRYYVKNQAYPVTLNDLRGEYVSESELNLYRLSYVTNSSRKDFVLFATIFEGSKYSQYGITSSYDYPHEITKYDIDRLNKQVSSSP
jgi:hypothetical protein